MMMNSSPSGDITENSFTFQQFLPPDPESKRIVPSERGLVLFERRFQLVTEEADDHKLEQEGEEDDDDKERGVA